MYLDEDLLRRYINYTHNRTEQEVYAWMTTSEMGFPVTQEREEKFSVGGTLWKTDRCPVSSLQ